MSTPQITNKRHELNPPSRQTSPPQPQIPRTRPNPNLIPPPNNTPLLPLHIPKRDIPPPNLKHHRHLIPLRNLNTFKPTQLPRGLLRLDREPDIQLRHLGAVQGSGVCDCGADPHRRVPEVWGPASAYGGGVCWVGR